MIDGFVKMERHAFYVDIWPRIKNTVDAVQSNLDVFKRGDTDTLLIHWGYKDAVTGEPVVLAITENVRGSMDENWVAPHLLVPQA